VQYNEGIGPEAGLYGDVNNALVRRTENQLEDVRAFLNMLVSQEAVYKVKVDCI